MKTSDVSVTLSPVHQKIIITVIGAWLRRLTLAAVLVVVARLMYSVADLLLGSWYSRIFLHHPQDNASYWQTYGLQWGIAITGLLPFATLLFWLRKKNA